MMSKTREEVALCPTVTTPLKNLDEKWEEDVNTQFEQIKMPRKGKLAAYHFRSYSLVDRLYMKPFGRCSKSLFEKIVLNTNLYITECEKKKVALWCSLEYYFNHKLNKLAFSPSALDDIREKLVEWAFYFLDIS